MDTLKGLLIAGIVLVSGPQAAQALMVTDWTHNSGSTASDYTLTITESPDMTRFNFMLSVDPGYKGDLLALGFNGLNYNSSNLNVMGSNVTGAFFDTLTCAQGCNFNGDGNPGLFDVIVRFGSQGMGSGAITSTSFSIAKLGFSLADFTDFGVRAQTTGLVGCGRNGVPACGSDKAYAKAPAEPVPEPASVVLLGFAALIAGAMRHKQLS